MKLKISTDLAWKWFIDEETIKTLDTDENGKWLIFAKHENIEYLDDLVLKGFEQESFIAVKRTNEIYDPVYGIDSVVYIFYANYSDYDRHIKILSFLKENNLIRKTKTGKYFNISFKLDEQTLEGEYMWNGGVNSTLKLNMIMDLDTGDFYDEKTFRNNILDY
ncbi:hypothetical protein ACJA23_02860 [Mycoplasma corogypsi]|uniref:hypothetical protein n=1 Tax=Mycoplasma corogypsi TaxID=2106 RepID=UPI003872DD9E